MPSPYPHRLFLLGLLTIFLPSAAHAIDCTQTTVLAAPSATIPEQTALRVLLEESAKRTGTPWATATTYPRKATSGCLIVAASQANLPALLPSTLQRVQFKTPAPPESFSLNTFLWHGRETIVLAGQDSRGLLYAVGALLRTMEFSPGKALLSQQLHLAQSPAKPIRGHQLGYRAKNNTYDAWTLAQFEQYIRELALFGANTIQLIAPDSDDAPTSPLFPAPALETLLGISKILDQYGLDCSLFYPEMEPDYAKPEDVARELVRFEKLLAQIPRVDSIWIPGGDPGHTPPNLLFPLVEKEAAILHRSHPHAKIYLSAQGMSAEHFADFYRQLDEKPAWLTGIFFGPQSRDSFETQRRRIPARYPILFYPDIAHTLHAQFPVPNWDPVFALTEGREPINPRPIDEAAIYRHFASLQAGFITYSEGVNDDANKFLWTAWGWNPATSAQSILEDYSRIFLSPELAKPFTRSLFALEENWRGPILQNTQIERTATELETLSREPTPPREIQGQRPASYQPGAQPQQENHSSTQGPKARSIALRTSPAASAGVGSKILFEPIQQALKDNWRFELALERAHYDAFLQQRLTAETDRQKTALAALGQARQTGSEKALANAEDALTSTQVAAAERAQVFALADNLFHHIGLQLSTTLYQASNWERGANLDRIDIPLNDRVWLANQFTRIRKLPTEAEKRAAIAQIVHWDAPQPGTLHDDLGNPKAEPHLVPGKGFAEDPELYQTAINGVSDHTPLDGSRWSQLTYAETLYETPLQLAYTDLDPAKHYRLRVTYGGEDYTAPIGIRANNSLEIQPQHNRATNPETLEFDIPQSATSNGNLTLEFTRPTGTGGSGRGHQVAEVWLIPQP